MARRLAAAAVACAAVALTGCGVSSREPVSVAGVQSAYRAIDADAASGNFDDLCRRYLDAALLAQLSIEHKQCPAYMSEHWGEFTPASKVGSATRIAVAGTHARVYDGSPPEQLDYVNGQWVLTRIPRSGERATGFIRKLDHEAEALNEAANREPSG